MIGPRARGILSVCMAGLLLAGCASHDARDPFESYNRRAFAFNLWLDKVAVRPVAVFYQSVTPTVIDTGITHFFSNLGQINAIANDLLQFQVVHTLKDTSRFLINSTLGVLGFFDVATPMGLPKHHQDFGLTLAAWGFKEAPYLVLPFFGPSTLRDVFSIPIDYCFLSAWSYIQDDGLRTGLVGLHLIDTRANLLAQDELVTKAFDPYVFVREAYLQKRADQIDPLDAP